MSTVHLGLVDGTECLGLQDVVCIQAHGRGQQCPLHKVGFIYLSTVDENIIATNKMQNNFCYPFIAILDVSLLLHI